MKTMKSLYPRLLSIPFIITFFILSGVASAQFSTLTNETRANTTTAGDQWGYWWSVRTVAVQPDGGYIIVWIDAATNDGQGNGIYAQRFDATGTKVGAEFLVNTSTAGDQFSPSVASAPDGSFAVAWEGAGTSIDVFCQLYTKDGVRKGPEFLLNTTVTGNQRYPEIQYYSDGTFVAGFVDGAQTVLQRFDADGRTLGLETRISSGTGNVVIDGLCVRRDNSILLTWTSGGDVYGQLFNSTLQSIGSQTKINTYVTGTQEYVNARVDAQGNFIAVWESAGQDGSGMGMYGRRFDKNFNPISGEFAITTNTTNDQFEPQIAVEPSGRFIIVWSDNNNRDGGGGSASLAGPGCSIWMREYDVNGNPVGAETMINQSITGYQGYPVIDINASGRFVISWEGNGTIAGQVDNFGIYSRCYQLSQTGTTSITVSPVSVTASDIVTVTMTLSALSTINNVTPNPPSLSGTNGVFATLVSGPTPSTVTVGVVPVSITWTYRVTAFDQAGQLTFRGNACSTTGNIFPYAASNTISVKPSFVIGDLTAPNLINDSNNPNAGPRTFTIGAKIINLSVNSLTNVMINLGDGINSGIFPVTQMSLGQTNNTYQGNFSLIPMAGTSDCSRSLVSLGAAKNVIAGFIDFNGDNLITSADDGVLSNGKVVVDGKVDVDKSGSVTAADDLKMPPGVFTGYREPSIIDGLVDTNRDGVISIADGNTYGGETKNIYWQVVYQVVDANSVSTFGDCNNFADDLRYRWTVWATAKDGAASRTTAINEYANVRCEQSASANKISPTSVGYITGGPPRILSGLVDINCDGTITTADDGPYYGKNVIDGKVDMNNSGTITTTDDGILQSFPVIDGMIDINGNFSISSADNAVIVQPGNTFSITVHNASFGTIGAGFDANRDNLWDYDFWYQPIGSTTWPAGSFRLVDIQADIVGTGGNNPLNNIVTHYDNEPYLSRLFDDGLSQSGGFNGTYTYTFQVINLGNGFITPYQEAASGTNNEKYCGDFGTGVSILSWLELPLSIKGLNVTARLNGTDAVVDWKTESEVNSDYFVIERSIDNKTFIRTSSNIKAAGNNTVQTKYQFTDDISDLIQYSEVYYRVRETDIDGKTIISNVVVVKLNKTADITTWPNPFVSSVTININSIQASEMNFNLINVAGIKVRSFSQKISKGINQVAIQDLENLPGGIYILEIVDKNSGKRTITKLIRN
jgi:hypothetical protein